jgi:hypothetical protein
LPAAVLLVALGGFLLLLTAQAPDQPAPQQPPLPRMFYQDFRNGQAPTSPVHRFGPDYDLVTRADNDGYRITLPALRKNPDVVGLIVTSAVSGNFEITTGYDLIDLGHSKTDQLVGVELYLMTDTPTQESVGLYRGIQGKEREEVFSCMRMTGPKGKRSYPNHIEPATTKSGRLRVTRTGTEVVYWAAEDEGEFRELWCYELNTEDLRMVRIAAYTSRTPEAVDVRIRDLRIRATDMAIDEATGSPAVAEAPPASKGRGWLIVGGLTSLLLAGGIVAGVFLVRRSRRVAGVMLPAAGYEHKLNKADQAVASVVSFSCSSCGKDLRARSHLAGKKVKCTQCAKPVLVPSIRAR